MAGVVFTAQTGINYRRYKKGQITKDQFKNRTKRGAAGTIGGMAGSASGMFAGFFAGQLLIPVPVLGGVIGSLVGGFAGGFFGAKVSIRVYERIEARLNVMRALKRAAQEEQERIKNSIPLTYEESLEMLGVRADDSFDFIFFEYQMLMLHVQVV